MTDPHRESPPGLPLPDRNHRVVQPFEPADWILYALLIALAAGGTTGWRTEDWWLGGAVAGGVYALALLTIIALKD